jgi:ribonuclease HI
VQVVVHVDGGARGNPGPAAAAAVVSAPDGRVLDQAAVTLGHATNNVAEYRGLLLGLERAAALGATAVEVVNDSELVAKQVNAQYKVKHADLKPLHARALEALGAFERWSIRSVPRAENAAADALVNRALDGEGIPVLQRPITPGAGGEQLLDIVHQATELWFGLILHELTTARDELADGRPHVAAPRLRRVVAVWRPLFSELDVLETIGPEGFLEFRDPPAPAGPSLYEAFVAGLGLPEERAARLGALADLYRDHAADPLRAAWHDVAELLVDHDEFVQRWRHRHALMAARAIGTRPGTGVESPPGTVDRRLFPELWDVRLAR